MLHAREHVKHPRPFRASARQVQYLNAWLDPTLPKTISGIAAHIHTDRRTIQLWLASDAFADWFGREVDRQCEHLWKPALLKVSQLAIQGSPEHFKLLAQVRGALRTESGAGGSGGVTVVVGVPRPGDIVEIPREPARPALPAALNISEH